MMLNTKNKIYFLKIIALSSLLFFCLFLFGTKTSKAALGTAACNAKGGSCDFTCWSSDYESLGDCDYVGKICCRKKLVDTSGADPDPAGKGNFAAGSCGSSGEGTCKFFAAFGSICGNDENIGQSTCSWSQVCCVPKANNVGVGSTTPATANPTTGASPTTPGAAGAGGAGSGAGATKSVPNGGLVPCGLGGAADCTLCHLVLGFKNIYDYLLVLLLSATTLVVVVAGVMYMVSSGDKGMIDKAKSALTYALTAMILALTAWLIINATLSALGYTKVGSWYNFTCDTAQTQGPTGGTGTGTLPGNTGGRSGSYIPSGNLDPRVQKVLGNYMTMDGMKYGQSFDNAYGGRSTAVCGSTVSRAWLMDGLPDYEKLTPERWDGDINSLKPGDICLFDKKATGIDHAFMIMDQNGMTTAAGGSSNTIRTSANGRDSNIDKLNGNTGNLFVFHIANYLNK